MQPSTAAAGPTAVQSKPQGPPGPGLSSVQRAAGAEKSAPSSTAPAEKGWPRHGGAMTEHPSTIRGDLAAAGLLPAGESSVAGPGGDSLPATTSLRQERAKRRLDAGQRDALFGGGWHVVYAKRGAEDGLTSHRGVLHPDEYVDMSVLRALVEAELGFSYEQVRSVYRQGPLSARQRELRGRIDARVLALSHAGANLALLGRLLGFPVKDNGNCRAMENALARARKEAS